ncbi:MAG: anthranilate phosphoribosyltransferase [Dehalococcoidia bacterium]|nr:anthranilate phosphoribosyltransferase [Dehalococcoidia bacterium]
MIKEAIATLVTGRSLSMDQAESAMTEIMNGEVTPAQFGAFVTALRIKGETSEEIAGMARVMRARAIRVRADGVVVDTCGTGGDNAGTINISTAAAFVAAGAGLKVAKHGNRAASSRCGSADVLEALGVKIELNAEQVERCLQEVGIGFMFAPAFHPAMKYAGPPRREIGIRTVFNILGPLTNPAHAQAQVLGVADASLAEKMAVVLRTLGCRHALVVHGDDGLDEITITGKTQVHEVENDRIKTYSVGPEDFGFSRTGLEQIKGSTPTENAALVRQILAGTLGPQREVVVMNAAAAIVAGDRAKSLPEGARLAAEAIDTGRALDKLQQLVSLSQALSS